MAVYSHKPARLSGPLRAAMVAGILIAVSGGVALLRGSEALTRAYQWVYVALAFPPAWTGDMLARVRRGLHTGHLKSGGLDWPSVSFLLTQSNVPDNYYADEGGCRIVVVGQNGQSSTLSGLGSLHAKQRQGPSFCSPVESGERVD